jgi:hypothetical protein
MYNPETVAEAKKRAEFALLKRESEDNAIAAERGLKPYKLLNVELNNGSDAKTGGYIGWYYVTLAVEGKVFGHLTSNLNSDISRGVVGEETKRRDYFVAGGLHDGEEDYVFYNVGHSTTNTSYKMELSDEVLQRARETLDRRDNFKEALEGMKTVEKQSKTRENKLYDKLTELFPDFMSGKFSYLKLESPGMEPLSLEWIGAEIISVMQTYTMNGDLMYDPMMTFWVDRSEGSETLRAESFEHSMPPVYQTRGDGGEWQSVDGNGNVKTLYLDQSVGKFAEQWFTNIAEQGYMPVFGNLVRGEDDEVRVTFDKDGNAIEPEPETGNVPYDEAAWHDLADIEDDDLREEHRAEINEILNGGKSEKQTTLDLSLPDPAWTVAEMNEYGYTAPDMYPLSVGRALELFDAGHTVYMLYDDNTEVMAFDRDEIITFSSNGFCGITKTDWEMSPIRDAQNKVYENVVLNREQAENSKESELIHSREPMFGIYQVRDDLDEKRGFRFAPMREIEALGLSVDRENYELVYSAPLTQRFLHGMLNDNDRTLETLYTRFNDSLPSDYAARSVSVSDVIVLQQGGEVTAHFVDSAGFMELPSFTGNEREQTPTLSQLDTSSPSVADLEADVKAGKSIFVAELAKAVNAESKDNPRIIIGGIPPQNTRKPMNKGVPSLMDEINEAKQLATRGGQPTAKQNGREV